eukprot:CAMPEP_0197527596 /NCGR_PEP_ID=MMETSP1318-20131121/22273_1 /TAXON_ID=552666 /ORGANISM="Partenskyella glossopodia, Strain RCC365" /LENGTH=187 /DNA_ID=CAMNT_0043082339 /DNA_START=160 /DNA_END=723 /DNA_ORIENTATION=+
MCLGMAAVATLILDVSEPDLPFCKEKYQKWLLHSYVLGCIVLGYLYAAFHGFTMIGPEVIEPVVSLFIYFCFAVIFFLWSTYGSVAIGLQERGDCTHSSLYGVGIAYLIIYMIIAGCHAAFTIYGVIQGIITGYHQSRAATGAGTGSPGDFDKKGIVDLDEKKSPIVNEADRKTEGKKMKIKELQVD